MVSQGMVCTCSGNSRSCHLRCENRLKNGVRWMMCRLLQRRTYKETKSFREYRSTKRYEFIGCNSYCGYDGMKTKFEIEQTTLRRPVNNSDLPSALPLYCIAFHVATYTPSNLPIFWPIMMSFDGRTPLTMCSTFTQLALGLYESVFCSL